MLLPLLCILAVLQAVVRNTEYESPPQTVLLVDLDPNWQSLLIWVSYLVLIFLITYCSSKFLPERARFYSTGALQIVSTGLLILLMPSSKKLALTFRENTSEWCNATFDWQLTGELFFLGMWVFLVPFLIAQVIVLVKPGFDTYSSYKKSLGAAIRFLLLLLAPFLIVSPLMGFLPKLLSQPHYQMPLNAALILLIVSLAPILLKFLMKTKLLPQGDVKDSLEKQAVDSQVKYNSLRIWESGPGQINAAVIGSIAPFRYLVITRGMMESFSLSEIKQVFWHEFGHVKHRHMWVYFLFFNLLANFGSIADNYFPDQSIDLTWEFSIATLLFFGIGFSFISRRLEKQADLFALTHSKEQENYCAVLKKLSALTGIPYKFYSLTHGSIKQRVTFLESVLASPQKAITFNRHLRWIIWTMVIVFALQWAYWFQTYVM